jgi:hypothetical protein
MIVENKNKIVRNNYIVDDIITHTNNISIISTIA